MMTKAICYDEFCGADKKIHFWNIVLGVLVIATAITSIVLAGTVLNGLETVIVPWYPTDF
jgi:hypothetical protein